MAKPLTESVLCRLTSADLVACLGQAERFEVAMHPGCCLALCNEAVADLNFVVAGRGASVSAHFAEACQTCISRNQPFLAMIFPEAGSGVEETAADLGLIHVIDWPIMVRDEALIEPAGNDTVVVRPASGAEGADANARVLNSAFGMPYDCVRRVCPPALMDSPNLDIFLATIDDVAVGAVTVTYHGDTSGIYAMGTDTARQRAGIGRRLLSTAMAEASDAGARRFFLGATAAGYRLYESLGYTTRVVARVWAFGQDHEASRAPVERNHDLLHGALDS